MPTLTYDNETLEQSVWDVYNDLNNTDREFPGDILLHHNLEYYAKETPDAIAISFDNESLTYHELNKRANQLARLLRAKGIGSDIICPVISNRCAEMMISIFAVLKAGGAYLPIATSDPIERVKTICEDCNAKVIVVTAHSDHQNIISANFVDASVYKNYGHFPEENLPEVNSSDDLAYVIYTSGSTGKPKGVMIEHKAVINRLQWMQNEFPIDNTSVLLQKTPICFDVSVWELFLWTFVGARLCLLKPNEEKFPPAIINTLITRRVSIMHFVPSMLNVFLGYLKMQDVEFPALKRVFCSGEALLSSIAADFDHYMNKDKHIDLINLYGPTEATVDVSYYQCQPGLDSNIPIGKPIENIQLWIIKDNKVMGIGEQEKGELCISGVGLARGYINRPELTHQTFTNHPEIKDLRIYKTGDLAYMREDLNIVYLGRIDNQVKVRGLRIELGEIESVIATHEDIEDTCVVVKKFSESVVMIVAYVVSDKKIEMSALKKFVSFRLPDYMVPDRVVQVEAIDLTPNGKKDRKKLSRPEWG
ncbi:MAG: amino acid adenylation domain-containing protein [Bacteroidota bacterium]